MPFTRPTRPDQYDPALMTRFFRSQYSWNGEKERNNYYESSPQIAGWAAARPSPNMVPYVSGPAAYYNLPSGPTGPRQLLQQRTLPPTFEAGSYHSYLPERYSAPGSVDGLGECCPSAPVADMAAAVAQGIKRIMPELATSIGVQTGRANVEQYQAMPAQVAPPVRAFDFNAAPAGGVITINDPIVYSTIASHKVPIGYMAVAKMLLVDAESAAALDDVEWRITVGNVPVMGYNSLNQPDLNGGEPAAITVKAIEDQTIKVQARVRTNGNTHFVTALLRGWDFQPSRMTNLEAIEGWRGR